MPMTLTAPSPQDLDDLCARALSGERTALARVLTLTERGGESLAEVMRRLHPRRRSAWKVALSGPPGAGKSTLLAGLIERFADMGNSVGTLCADPTSPLSGGAILGDRIRMIEAQGKGRVFIRSLSSGDSLGGLGPAARPMTAVLEACGFDVILIETVGIGQIGYDARRLADALVLVATPESGDVVQTIKSGVMELADVVVVNKADRPGAGEMADALRQNFELSGPDAEGWTVPVVSTVATAKIGLDELMAALERRRALVENRRNRDEGEAVRMAELSEILAERLRANLNPNMLKYHPNLKDIAEKALRGETDPWSAAEAMILRLFSGRSVS